jgi:hypothetical protein
MKKRMIVPSIRTTFFPGSTTAEREANVQLKKTRDTLCFLEFRFFPTNFLCAPGHFPMPLYHDPNTSDQNFNIIE